MLNRNQVISRALFTALLLLATFILPWWWTALLALVGIFSFYLFLEAVFVGILVDVIYSASWLPIMGLVALGVLLMIGLVTYYISYQ
ncbi:MAG: hypothetical protein WD335_01805 [Candidatus Paceibacterota bacterium]